MNTDKLVIFSAPSGAGKTTIVHHLLKVIPQLQFSISACSRAMRKGEKNGEDYYFLSVDEFKNKIGADEFIEWEEVYKNNFYGTLKSEVERIWKLNRVAIFDVDVEGGINLKKKFGNKALAVFIMPPSVSSLRERLQQRETETPESIARRLGKAENELKTANRFDKIILNDSLSRALQEAELIVKEFLT
ncbi:MAG: guanylate kinase [Bacteroidia bacterium]|nr:guanylate kinase [Bacteroidia bacterium]